MLVKRLSFVLLNSWLIISGILSQIKKAEDTIAVYNPFNWPRSDYIIGHEHIYYVKEIPPFGIETYQKTKIKVPSPELSPIITTNYKYRFENDWLKAEINTSTGNISSMCLKATNKELLSQNQESGFRVYREKMDFMFPSWNIDPDYKQTPIPVELYQKCSTW